MSIIYHNEPNHLLYLWGQVLNCCKLLDYQQFTITLCILYFLVKRC